MFLGHVNDLKPGTWRVLAQCQGQLTLLNEDGKYYIQDNICPHQGSRIRQAHGSGLPVCPYHGWSWDQDGNPMGSGTVGHSRGTEFCKNQHVLTKRPAHEWNGFLFDRPIDVDIDIAGNYILWAQRQDEIKASYIPVMDLFLDIDHIPVVHPRVYDRIDIPNVRDVEWIRWSGGSVQVVKGNRALWLALYPGVMFEWQPGAVFVMVNQPAGDDRTISHVFKYRERGHDQQTWDLNEQVWEQAWAQDRAQAELLEPGWRKIPEHNLDTEKRNFRAYIGSL